MFVAGGAVMEKRIRAMYFSGTGTTEKVTTAVAYKMWELMDAAKTAGADGEKVRFTKAGNINFTPPEARKREYKFDENDIIVFGTPVIAGRVPNVLLKFLDTIAGGGAMAIPVVLYGNRNYDDALIELRNILENKGFHTVAGAAFIGEHSFSRKLAAGRPDAEDMKTADDFAGKAADKILGIINEAGGDNDKIEAALEAACPVYVNGCDPIRPYYKPRDRKGNHINILKVKPKLHADKCNGCGICIEVCPMGSIKPEAPGVVDGICIKCCGCEKKCPTGALYFDDPGYLYHKEELELGYPDRKDPELFV